MLEVVHVTTLTGNVHPQAGGWYFDHAIKVTRDDEEIQIILHNSNFVMRVISPGEDKTDEQWFIELWQRASVALRGALDSLGLLRGATLTVELIAGSVDNNAVVFEDPTKPNFALVQDARVESEKLGPLVRHSFENRHLRHALADLRQALALDDDASFYCYRAIESLRQHYLVGAEDDGAARRQSWEDLRIALGVAETDIEPIKLAARSRRHGGSQSADYAERKSHVIWTRDLIEKFAATLPTNLGREAELDL